MSGDSLRLALDESFQPSSVVAQPCERVGESGLSHFQALAVERVAQRVELHTRRILKVRSLYFYECSCSFFSAPLDTLEEAETDVCPIKSILAGSAERRAIHGR